MVFLGRFQEFSKYNSHDQRIKSPQRHFLQFFDYLLYIFGIYFQEKLPFWAFYVGIKLNFQAVIKSAASAASPTAWGAPDDGARWDDGVGRTTERIRTTARGAPQAVGEAALAADLITA